MNVSARSCRAAKNISVYNEVKGDASPSPFCDLMRIMDDFKHKFYRVILE